VTRRTRLEQAEHIAAAESRLAAGETQREVAAALGVARSTLLEWCHEQPLGDAPAGLVAFVRTPEGMSWLHRMVIAAHFSITLRAAGGTRLVSEFLELSGLSAFVGVSDGAQHKLNAALEAALVTEAEAQRTTLGEGMAPRQVTVCEDETFHPGACLVAIEPVSNFILLEGYAADRSAATWTAALEEACTGLAVE
jgi:transposase-like protein